MKILVTGAAGFIGSRLIEMLTECGDTVIGIDNLNTYYDPALKLMRLEQTGINLPADSQVIKGIIATGHKKGRIVSYTVPPYDCPIESGRLSGYTFINLDITDRAAIDKLMAGKRFDVVMNLAAQAGVRYSIENPMSYIECNVNGFMNLLDAARRNDVGHFVYASSSSVYGGNTKTPFNEDDRVDSPVSLYAATKKSDELFARVYSHIYGLPTTGLRYFTVYGPWGRPDMAPMLFAQSITEGRPISVFNGGNLSRDFTYIDDIAAGTAAVIHSKPAHPAKAEVYNIGCGHPVELMEFISELENAIGREAIKEMKPMQPGDVFTTYADTSRLREQFGYKAATTLAEGIRSFATWFREVYPRLSDNIAHQLD